MGCVKKKTKQECETALTSQFDSLKKFEKLKKGWISLIEKKLEISVKKVETKKKKKLKN